jgi:hypothetical protein
MLDFKLRYVGTIKMEMFGCEKKEDESESNKRQL